MIGVSILTWWIAAVYRSHFWIGLSDIAKHNEYVWVDGTQKTDRKAFWEHGEPNNKIKAGDTQDCVSIERGYVSDQFCRRRLKYICEKDMR